MNVKAPPNESFKKISLASGEWIEADLQESLQHLLEHPDTPELVRQCLQLGLVTWQMRNETSLLGGLRQPQYFALQAALAALGAELTSPNGKSVSVQSYLKQRTAAKEAAALRIPLAASSCTWSEEHLSRTPADDPIVMAVAVLDWDGDKVKSAQLVMNGVSHQAIYFAEQANSLEGAHLTKEAIQSVAKAIESAVEPKSDYRASAEYRKAMAAVISRRSLENCIPGGQA
jgi:CO/xanthine dehydrogenase FAD-binding subunit